MDGAVRSDERKFLLGDSLYQTPDFLGVVLQITNLSNNMLILQLQSIATTSCNLKLS